MLMRPIRYALQAVERRHLVWNNDGIPTRWICLAYHRFWQDHHEFKTALFLATRAGFDKVIFLVDRRELDIIPAKSSKPTPPMNRYRWMTPPIHINCAPVSFTETWHRRYHDV